MTDTNNGTRKATTKATKPKQPSKEGRTKTDIVAGLLKRKDGCTRADVLAATGWPSVSMPAIAKAAKLKLRSAKGESDKVTRYWGSSK